MLRLPLPRIVCVALVALTMTACGMTTAPTADEVASHRAAWNAQHLSNYSYDYKVTGFLIAWAGRVVQLEVRNNAVVTAVYADTGQPVPGSPTQFPTIDTLFDQAAGAADAGALRAITFDSERGYPLQMDLSGPPDASGSVFASQLQPIS
jgi:Family of unknown function (DUF6174)